MRLLLLAIIGVPLLLHIETADAKATKIICEGMLTIKSPIIGENKGIHKAKRSYRIVDDGLKGYSCTKIINGFVCEMRVSLVGTKTHKLKMWDQIYRYVAIDRASGTVEETFEKIFNRGMFFKKFPGSKYNFKKDSIKSIEEFYGDCVVSKPII